MPLKKSDKPKNVYYNIRELLADNAKKGKERGNKGKKRSMKQILAIAYNIGKKKKTKSRAKKK